MIPQRKKYSKSILREKTMKKGKEENMDICKFDKEMIMKKKND